VLKLSLIPGLIHELRFEDKETTGTWKNAFPTSAGKLLNLRDIEQGLEQMKRIPSQEVDMQIVPADKLGESDVVITVKRGKPWKIMATLDDSGAKGTGKLQAGLNFAYDNLFNINYLFNVGISNDADNNNEQRGTQGSNAYYSVPYGNWTHTYMANDPVSVIAAFNPGDFWGAFKEFYNVYAMSNGAHSCYGSGSFGCSTIANPVPGGPVPTNQNSGLIRVYRGGELVSPQPIVSGGQP
jgi:hypothetical protein